MARADPTLLEAFDANPDSTWRNISSEFYDAAVLAMLAEEMEQHVVAHDWLAQHAASTGR